MGEGVQSHLGFSWGIVWLRVDRAQSSCEQPFMKNKIVSYFGACVQRPPCKQRKNKRASESHFTSVGATQQKEPSVRIMCACRGENIIKTPVLVPTSSHASTTSPVYLSDTRNDHAHTPHYRPKRCMLALMHPWRKISNIGTKTVIQARRLQKR